MSEPKYYIWASDPHGTGQAWIELVHQAQTKYPDNQTVFGGDYIDGNPNPRPPSILSVTKLNTTTPSPCWAIMNNY